MRKLIPKSLLPLLRKIRKTLHISVLKIGASTRTMSRIFYFFFRANFLREQYAVISGIINYERNLVVLRETSALLRRNIHRLEKGLIMIPRRPSFAESYILETVEIFFLASQKQVLNEHEFNWAHDVLLSYFEAVTDTSKISEAREVFERAIQTHQVTESSLEMVPYRYKDLPPLEISDKELHNLYLRRRSVRWYKDKPVDLSLISKAIDMASTAPSACNRQPYRFDVSVDPIKAKQIASLAGGTPGWGDNIQALVVIVGDLSSYYGEHDRHLIYIDGALVAMQFMLALDPLGLASCPVNWPDHEYKEKKMDAMLNLKEYERPIMLITVGYPDNNGGIAFSQKKTSSSLMRVIQP